MDCARGAEMTDLFQPLFDLGSVEPSPVAAAPLDAVSERKRGWMEQIRRDLAVLREAPIYHVPSAEFYEQRIAACRRELTGVKGA